VLSRAACDRAHWISAASLTPVKFEQSLRTSISLSGGMPEPESAMFKVILVPTDGTTPSNHAVKTAAALATDLGASLMVFHASRTYDALYFPDGVGMVWPPKERYQKEAAIGADKVLASASAVAKKLGAKATTAHSYSDSPADAILAAAKKCKADLIVMASHGRKGLDKLLLGSETQRVLARTKLPVLVVR